MLSSGYSRDSVNWQSLGELPSATPQEWKTRSKARIHCSISAVTFLAPTGGECEKGNG